jgi:hypothetical protein
MSLIWCIGVLALSMTRKSPRTSLFPEVDFASKVARTGVPVSPRHARSQSRDSFQNVLSGLSNADSREIRRGLAPSTFYVRIAEPEFEGDRPVTMTSEENWQAPYRAARI